MYDWSNVAERTERVYERVMAQDERDLGERLARYVLPSSTFVINLGAVLSLGCDLSWLQPVSIERWSAAQDTEW